MILASGVFAQVPRHELALTLGQVRSQTQTYSNGGSTGGTVPIELGSGSALQAGYGFRVAGGGAVAVYVGAHFLASPQRRVTSLNTLVTKDFASLYLVPQLTLKFRAGRRVSPWGTFGGGYGLYEQSATRLDGAANPAPRHVSRGTFLVGGGVDVKLVRLLALRGELRDFFTGRPELNVPISGGQHNVLVGGGIVLRF